MKYVVIHSAMKIVISNKFRVQTYLHKEKYHVISELLLLNLDTND